MILHLCFCRRRRPRRHRCHTHSSFSVSFRRLERNPRTAGPPQKTRLGRPEPILGFCPAVFEEPPPLREVGTRLRVGQGGRQRRPFGRLFALDDRRGERKQNVLPTDDAFLSLPAGAAGAVTAGPLVLEPPPQPGRWYCWCHNQAAGTGAATAGQLLLVVPLQPGRWCWWCHYRRAAGAGVAAINDTKFPIMILPRRKCMQPGPDTTAMVAADVERRAPCGLSPQPSAQLWQ